MEGRCVLAPKTGKARLLTVDRRTGGTARRWVAENRRRSFTLGQGAIAPLPPNLSLAPKSLVTVAVCSSKTRKQLYAALLLEGRSG